MRVLALLALLTAVAACSKHEPPPLTATAPVKVAPVPAAPVPVPTPPVAPAPTTTTADGLPSVALAKEGKTFESIMQDGSAVYDRVCATCHMADGNGVPFMQPAIKGSAWISNPDPQLLLSLILRGAAVLGEAANAYDNKMAPQDALSDAEIAAVATYVRQRFAAEPITQPVTSAEVAIARARPGLPP